MVRVLFIGNMENSNGPSIVNKSLFNELKNFDEVLFLKSKNKIAKIIECIFKIFPARVITISGIGYLNMLAVIVAKLFRKKICYLMHGAVELENKYTPYPRYYSLFEKTYLLLCDKIICVSENYKQILLKDNYYSMYGYKFVSINNGINITKAIERGGTRDKNIVLSLGGGRREKNNLSVCRAIDMLDNPNIKYIVIGKDGGDTEEIKKYSFVEYKGILCHEDVVELMKRCNVYIQNSIYESFGIAPLEALFLGCTLILSDQMGCISVFKKIPDKTIVYSNSVDELKSIIEFRLQFSNNNDLLKSIDEDAILWKNISKQYIELWNRLGKKGV